MKTIGKTMVLLTLLCAVLLLHPGGAAAHSFGMFTLGSRVYGLDGQQKNMDVAPYTQNGRTFIPVGYLAEILGLTASYDQHTGICLLTDGTTNMQLKMGSTTALVNDGPLVMDVSPVLSPPGRIMLPARWVARSFGWQVSWDGAKGIVTVFYPGLIVEDYASVNVRQGPGLHYPVVATMSRGTAVTAVAARDGWLQVVLAGGKTGWVASWVVNRSTSNTSGEVSRGGDGHTPPGGGNLPGNPAQPGSAGTSGGTSPAGGASSTGASPAGGALPGNAAQPANNGSSGGTVPGTPAGGQTTASEPLVRVCLAQNLASLSFSVNGASLLADQADGRTLAVLSPGVSYQLIGSGGQWQLTGNAQPVNISGAVVVAPAAGGGAAAGGPALISLSDGRTGRYRGSLLIYPAAGGLTVVNRLGVEEYLYGVVPCEMPSSWPAEALKAQAVAARTYALNAVLNSSGKLYDLNSDQSSQVYGGYDREAASTDSAVDATRGMVITYQNRPIDAVFCASDGGFTENCADVWGTGYPYLQGKADPYDQNAQNPYKSWQVTLTSDQLIEQLKQNGYNFTCITGLDAAAYTSAGKRVKVLRISGLNAGGEPVTAEFSTADKVRRFLGLRGSPFSMQPNYSIPVQAASGAASGSAPAPGQTAGVSGGAATSGAAGGNQAVAPPDGAGTATPAAPGGPVLTSVTFSGAGYGHDVGMSQYGACGMALDNMDYRSILQFYYTGVTIEDNYGD